MARCWTEIPRSARRYLRFGRYAHVLTPSLRRALGVSTLPVISDRRSVRAVLRRLRRKQVIRAGFNPRTIRESRFTALNAIVRRRQRSCGSLATVVASVFRSAGIPIKLVDGWLEPRGEGRRHAWNDIWVADERRFVAFDITRKSFRVGRRHIRRRVFADWGEMERVYKPGRRWVAVGWGDKA